MVSGGMKCAKYLLFGFNLIIVVAGLALIIAGALVQTKFNSYLAFFEGRVNAAAIFILIVGVIVFVIGFFGCCGAAKENHCMIITFVVLLCIVLALEVAATIVAFVLKDKITGVVGSQLKKAVVNYGVKDHGGVTKAWDQVQTTFQCCGAENYTDWRNNTKLRATYSVPDSCCVAPQKAGCGQGKLISPTGIHLNPCGEAFKDWIGRNIVIVGGIAAAICFIEIFGIVLAGCLASAVRREYESV